MGGSIHRRALVVAAAAGVPLGLAVVSRAGFAQRPANPIARPPRPAGPFGPGRLPDLTDGANRTQPPGVFVVRAVNDRDNIVQISDASGRTAGVYVAPDLFDVAELKPGDEIVIDFVVPNDANARLEAAGVWRK